MWRERMDVRVIKPKICPFMSRGQVFVLCRGSNCAAAYPRRLMGETFWVCELIEGHPPDTEGDYVR
jgi:hypothetical protein